MNILDSHNLSRDANPTILRLNIQALKNRATQEHPQKSEMLAEAKFSVRSFWLVMAVVFRRFLLRALSMGGAITAARQKDAATGRPILMCFSSLSGLWHCSFYEDARRTRRLPKRLTFRDSAKLWTAAKHGNVDLSSAETRQRLEHDIRLGYGTIWLQLSDEQIATLA